MAIPIIRNSERKSFRACPLPQQWWWGWRMGLVPKGKPAAALWLGTGVHLALAKWYRLGFRRGPLPAKTFSEWAGDEIAVIPVGRNEFGKQEFEDARDLGVTMLTRYVEQYGRDSSLEILAIEQSFQIDVIDDGEVIAILAGTFDGAAVDHYRNMNVLLEHKTATTIATAYLSLDDQAGTYFSVADIVLHDKGILNEDEHIEGVLYNFLRKARHDDRPKNSDGLFLNISGEVSKNQPPPFFTREVIDRTPGEVRSQLVRMAKEVRIMNGVRDGSIPLTKNTTWMCPRCQFFDLCVMDEKGNKRAVQNYIRSSFTVRDPYADHRKSTSE